MHGPCATEPAPLGIFTSTSGTAPNRIFNIEWRTIYFDRPDDEHPAQLRGAAV